MLRQLLWINNSTGDATSIVMNQQQHRRCDINCYELAAINSYESTTLNSYESTTLNSYGLTLINCNWLSSISPIIPGHMPSIAMAKRSPLFAKPGRRLAVINSYGSAVINSCESTTINSYGPAAKLRPLRLLRKLGTATEGRRSAVINSCESTTINSYGSAACRARRVINCDWLSSNSHQLWLIIIQ